jgi:hypothetical protein
MKWLVIIFDKWGIMLIGFMLFLIWLYVFLKGIVFYNPHLKRKNKEVSLTYIIPCQKEAN